MVSRVNSDGQVNSDSDLFGLYFNKNKLTKQTVKILMRWLIRSHLIRISTICKCMSEFT